MEKKATITVRVTINGGPENVHRQYGLTCNPFPAIPRFEYVAANRMLRELDSDPLASVDDVRRILAGCDDAFVDLCCQKFVAGQRVSFTIEFPE